MLFNVHLFLLYIRFCGGVSFICQVTLFHCTRLSCTLNIKSTKKKIRIWISNNSVDYYNFFSFLVLLSPYYLWYIFLTSIVWLPNMYMYGVGIDNHEEQIFQESSNVCKMIFLKSNSHLIHNNVSSCIVLQNKLGLLLKPLFFPLKVMFCLSVNAFTGGF